MVFYADTYFVLNFVADLLLLTATGAVCAAFAPKWRLVSAAVFGAGYAVLAAVGAEVFSGVFMYLLCAALMLIIAFGADKNFLRLFLVHAAMASAFGGVMTAMGIAFGENAVGRIMSLPSFGVFLGVFLLSYFLFSAVFKRCGRCEAKCSRVKIWLGQNSVELNALHDTGNSLSDPLTGRKVLVTSFDEVKKLFPKVFVNINLCGSAVDFAEAANSLELGCKFLLIPYKAVGTGDGLLAAFKPEKLVIDGKINNSYIVAISPNDVGDGGAYSALMGAA